MYRLHTRTFACIAYRLLIFGSLFFTHRLPAQLNHLASTEDGSSYEVCLEGDYLYVGAANTLKVYSLNGPGNTPDSNTYSLRLPSNIDQILARDGYLYVCANHAGLWKFNISNTPDRPDSVTKYVPSSINESIYDVAFYGDTLIAAAKHRLIMLSDSANTLAYLDTIRTYSGTTRVHGVDTKGDYLAFTVGFSANQSQDGVYLWDLITHQQLGFFNETSADPWEVYFGQSNSLLHVMGGNIPLTVKGLYYALNYSVPTSLQLAYSDTILGYGNSFAMPMSAQIIRDTVYIATHGAVEIGYTFPGPITGQVWVYDATIASNVQRIEDLYAGLYHFDIAIEENSRTMYVASEWYGVLTMDIADITNETNLGKTLTGGWCHGSAYAKNRLVEANEGYGVRLFDMTLPQSPQLIAADTSVGFCRAISMDDSAQYIYAWHLTDQRLRVYEADSLNLIADLGGSPFDIFMDDFSKSRIHGNYVAVIEDPTILILFDPFNIVRRILVADVSNPNQPTLLHVRTKNQMEDLAFHSSGMLIACAKDSVLVFEPSTMNVLSGVIPPILNNKFKAITLINDTLYAVHMSLTSTNEQIARYYINPSTFSLTYIDSQPFPLHTDYRVHLTTNGTVLYVSSSLDSLQAIPKFPPYSGSPLATYDHSADHMFDNRWGVTDLYYSQGLLVLNEYMGHSSIFGNPAMVSSPEPIAHEKGLIYPNPVRDRFALQLEATGSGSLEVFDLNGRKQYGITSYPMCSAISTEGWQSGIYFVVWQQGDFRWTGKMVKLE
jgi:hypothetical protein